MHSSLLTPSSLLLLGACLLPVFHAVSAGVLRGNDLYESNLRMRRTRTINPRAPQPSVRPVVVAASLPLPDYTECPSNPVVSPLAQRTLTTTNTNPVTLSLFCLYGQSGSFAGCNYDVATGAFTGGTQTCAAFAL